ncbi:MAG: CDP-diacylglycerol--serine O-phosphatidyltransferase [Magnetococcus sp. WYHC-3]
MTMETQRKTRKGVYILPNLLTTGGMFFGFYAVMAALAGEFEKGAMAIVVAGIFDGLDGRVARALDAVSSFGKEYDSLADFLSFGMAPAILIHQWALEPFHRVGLAGAFVFTVCGALRLARFNVQHYQADEAWQKRYFQGLPIPAAAGLVAATMLFYMELELSPAVDAARHGFWQWLPLLLVYLLGLLMVSPVRFRSFKDIHWHKARPFFTLVGAVVFIAVLTIHMAVTLFTLFGAYLVSGYWSHREYRRLLAEGKEVEPDEVADLTA